MLDDLEPEQLSAFRSYRPVNPYAVPQYPDHPNSYEVKPAAPQNYEQTYKPEYQAKPEVHPSPPQYEVPYQPKPSCGSNLLFGCQPHVQAVPCYPSQSYGPAPAYANPVYKQSSAPTYPNPPFSIPPPDVYSQPGPPYPEPSLSSVQGPSAAQDQIAIENSEKTFNSKLRQDSEPEPSNIASQTDQSENIAPNLVDETEIEKDNFEETSSTERSEDVASKERAYSTTTTEATTTEAVTTEATTTTTTTTSTTTTPAPVTIPSAEERIQNLHDSIDNHVENLKRFKEVAGQKLRDAIERSNSRSSADDLDDFAEDLDDFMNRPSFSKRQTLKSMNRDNAYNSIY